MFSFIDTYNYIVQFNYMEKVSCLELDFINIKDQTTFFSIKSNPFYSEEELETKQELDQWFSSILCGKLICFNSCNFNILLFFQILYLIFNMGFSNLDGYLYSKYINKNSQTNSIMFSIPVTIFMSFFVQTESYYSSKSFNKFVTNKNNIFHIEVNTLSGKSKLITLLLSHFKILI